MKLELEGIKTIIFDLGGVVLNLDMNRTFKAFANLAGTTTDELMNHSAAEEIFHPFETGHISAKEFLGRMTQLFEQNVSEEDIIIAWNAMLLDLPVDRINHLNSLRKKYKTIILSNTNDIHLTAFERIISEATSGNNLNDFFDVVYYSHQIGLRKPNPDIFEYVIKENELVPSETLFIDDMEQNVVGARAVGLKSWHLSDQAQLMTELTYE